MRGSDLAGAYFTMDKRRMAWVVRRSIADAIEDAGRYMVRYMRARLNIKYPPASSPGEYPRRRTGTLRDALFHKTNRHKLEGSLYFSDEAYYWRYLEEGTENMEARKLVADTIIELDKKISDRVHVVVRRALRQYQASIRGGKK